MKKLKNIISLILVGVMACPMLVSAENSLETENIDKMEIRFDNSVTKWEDVSIHYWGTGVEGTEWPGDEMQLVEGTEDIYSLEVPVGITGIVFADPNDSDALKSADVTDIPTREDWQQNNDIIAEYVSVGEEYGKSVVLRKDENGNVYQPPETPSAEQMVAKQVNTHVGKDYSEVYLAYTTVGQTEGKVVLTDKEGTTTEYTAESQYSPSAQKYQYSVVFENLKPNMSYTYTIGQQDYSFTGTFKSLPEQGSDEVLTFAYIADTQVGSLVDAEASNATLHYVSQYANLDFVYIGGDLTDNAESKLQWESLFESAEGQYPTGGAELLANNLLAVAQGNHDKNHDVSSLSGYINAPNEGGNLVYSVDYGNAKLIVLNLETAGESDEERDSQKAYLEQEVKEAKDAGQWTIVAFHKSIYTGGSHIVDDDIIEARTFWSPVLSELDIDVVLQAHDHVYARGFISGDGSRGDVQQDENGAYVSKDNTPLYMVGGHAGGLKWYSAIDYEVTQGDPLLENYEFLDVSSVSGENGTDVTNESMYTIVEVSDTEFKTTTYAFKYNQETHVVEKEPYIYDSVVLTRQLDEQAENTSNANDNNFVVYVVIIVVAGLVVCAVVYSKNKQKNNK